jgi:hypothetical protein
MDILGNIFEKSWNAKKNLERISARTNFMIGVLSVAPTQV